MIKSISKWASDVLATLKKIEAQNEDIKRDIELLSSCVNRSHKNSIHTKDHREGTI